MKPQKPPCKILQGNFPKHRAPEETNDWPPTPEDHLNDLWVVAKIMAILAAGCLIILAIPAIMDSAGG